MTQEGFTLETINGQSCVRMTRVLWSEPKIFTVWYPVAPESLAAARQLEGKQLDDSPGGGTYRLAPEDPAFWKFRELRVRLAAGEKTEPVQSREVDAPKPTRVRAELRWQHGAWEKLTRHGWRAA
jgi:hypothetical protein